MEASKKPKDAFALLMSAGRKQQQQVGKGKRTGKRSAGTQGSQQPKRKATVERTALQVPLAAESAPAVVESPTATPTQQQHSTTQQQQVQQQRLDHALPQTSEVGGSIQPQQQGSSPLVSSPSETHQATQTSTVSRQDAVDAFKRAFSTGQAGSRRLAPQKFDYLLVYDLEATTNQARTLHPVEIIELACVIIPTATGSISASYQSFVRPTEHPQLDPFVTELCGIQQQQVDEAPLLADVLQQHHDWLQQQGVLADGVTCVPVTWTEWDLKVALCTECGWRRIQRPSYLCRWVDLKRHYKARYRKAGKLQACVEAAGLTWQGRAHSGLDDATNTAHLAIHLMRHGVTFIVTQVSENPTVLQPQAVLHSSQSAPLVAAVTAASAGTAGSMPAEQGVAASSPAGSRGCSQGSTPRQGRPSMAQLAAHKGTPGVFDASGRWLGRCFCGAKAKQRVTKRPGANHGRQFWSCGCWTITAQGSSACEFFLWEDEVPPGSLKGLA